MKKFEAGSLEEAYRLACETFGCSMTELIYEIVQYPSRGIMGLFAKPAIIVAARRTSAVDPGRARKDGRSDPKPAPAGRVKEGKEKGDPEVLSDGKEGHSEEKVRRQEMPPEPSGIGEDSRRSGSSHEAIIDRFFGGGEGHEPASEPSRDERALQEEIEAQLSELMERSCFDIDVVEVDVVDKTAYIFLDGEDAALLIGKEGYRYNALSYLLFNWLHGSYQLFIKLEIAQFLSSQQEMIRHQLQPVIEHVEREGWGRTRPLDGILVQIALEQLREAFPDKYVAIKRQRDGGRYVLINEFNRRRR